MNPSTILKAAKGVLAVMVAIATPSDSFAFDLRGLGGPLRSGTRAVFSTQTILQPVACFERSVANAHASAATNAAVSSGLGPTRRTWIQTAAGFLLFGSLGFANEQKEFRFSDRQKQINQEEVDFRIQEFAPQLKEHAGTIANYARILTERRPGKWDGLIGIGIKVYVAIGVWRLLWASYKWLLTKQGITRREFIDASKKFVSAAFTASLLLFVQPSSGMPLGMFDGITKAYSISLQQIDSDAMFRLVITHELGHFFGDFGLDILPRDCLFADAYAALRVIQMDGIDALHEVYSAVQKRAELNGFTALERDWAFRQGELLWRQYRDPQLREAMLRRRLRQRFPKYDFLDHPQGDGDKPWVYLYGTATAAIAYQLVQAHQGDFSVGWRYLSCRSHGLSPAESEKRAAANNAPREGRTDTQILLKLKPDFGFFIKLGGLYAAAWFGGRLIVREVNDVLHKIRKKELSKTHADMLRWFLIRGSVTMATATLITGYVWWWTAWETVTAAASTALLIGIFDWTRSPTKRVRGKMPSISKQYHHVARLIRRQIRIIKGKPDRRGFALIELPLTLTALFVAVPALRHAPLLLDAAVGVIGLAVLGAATRVLRRKTAVQDSRLRELPVPVLAMQESNRNFPALKRILDAMAVTRHDMSRAEQTRRGSVLRRLLTTWEGQKDLFFNNAAQLIPMGENDWLPELAEEVLLWFMASDKAQLAALHLSGGPKPFLPVMVSAKDFTKYRRQLTHRRIWNPQVSLFLAGVLLSLPSELFVDATTKQRTFFKTSFFENVLLLPMIEALYTLTNLKRYDIPSLQTLRNGMINGARQAHGAYDRHALQVGGLVAMQAGPARSSALSRLEKLRNPRPVLISA